MVGLIDGDRVAVMGQSHGGYAVGALLCGSRLFRASVAMAGLWTCPRLSTINRGGPFWAHLCWSVRYSGEDGNLLAVAIVARDSPLSAPLDVSQTQWYNLEYASADHDFAGRRVPTGCKGAILRFGCSTSEAIRRAILGYRDHCLGVSPEFRATRTVALRELIQLFEGHDAQAEIDELKRQDDAG